MEIGSAKARGQAAMSSGHFHVFRSSGSPDSLAKETAEKGTDTNDDVGNPHPEEPWLQPSFCAPPSGKTDSWLLTHWEAGWFIRRHSKPRVKLFHPIHSSLPCRGTELSPDRVSLIFQNGKMVRRVHDVWVEPSLCSKPESSRWCGYTFFRKKVLTSAATATEAPDVTQTETPESVDEPDSSDDSFELCSQ